MARINQIGFISMAGVVLIAGGIIGIILGGYLFLKAEAGLESLDAVYATQGRLMTYDDQGNFTDRGTAEGGNAILSLLENDWKFPLNRANLDPNDLLVNTPDELMVQYAIISYHTLNGTVNVVLDEDVEYKGVVYKAGSYDVPVDGRYFSELDRKHPLEGPVRTQAWNPLAFGLQGQLIGGVVADNQAGLAHFMAWSIFAGLGFMFTVTGALVFVGGVQFNRKMTERVEVETKERVRVKVGGTATHGVG